MRASWKDKLPSILATLAMQAAVAALLLFSISAVRREMAEQETILFLAPARAPVVIDARQPVIPDRPKPPVEAPLSAPATNLPTADGSKGITALPKYAQPPSDSELMRRFGRAATCRPDEHGRLSSLCSVEVKPVDPRALVLNPPSEVKDPERWAEEKRRADSNDLGVAVGPGIGIVITNPLCKLAWVAFGGGFSCDPPPTAPRRYTDARFEAARLAHQRRRGGEPRAALTSPADQGK